MSKSIVVNFTFFPQIAVVLLLCCGCGWTWTPTSRRWSYAARSRPWSSGTTPPPARRRASASPPATRQWVPRWVLSGDTRWVTYKERNLQPTDLIHRASALCGPRSRTPARVRRPWGCTASPRTTSSAEPDTASPTSCDVTGSRTADPATILTNCTVSREWVERFSSIFICLLLPKFT